MKKLTEIITVIVKAFLAWWKLKTSSNTINTPVDVSISDEDSKKIEELFGGKDGGQKNKAIELIKGL
jgi:divalent metal cation (Fe/Co/Zn/Cd) transporter